MLVHQCEGTCKNFAFLVFADESKFVKKKETGFLQFLPLCSCCICALFDIHLFARREYQLNCWLLLQNIPILKVCSPLTRKDLCLFTHAVVLKLMC